MRVEMSRVNDWSPTSFVNALHLVHDALIVICVQIVEFEWHRQVFVKHLSGVDALLQKYLYSDRVTVIGMQSRCLFGRGQPPVAALEKKQTRGPALQSISKTTPIVRTSAVALPLYDTLRRRRLRFFPPAGRRCGRGRRL